jgi:hypothetical protein
MSSEVSSTDSGSRCSCPALSVHEAHSGKTCASAHTPMVRRSILLQVDIGSGGEAAKHLACTIVLVASATRRGSQKRKWLLLCTGGRSLSPSMACVWKRLFTRRTGYGRYVAACKHPRRCPRPRPAQVPKASPRPISVPLSYSSLPPSWAPR